MNFILSYALNTLWLMPLVAAGAWLVSRLCRQAHPRVLHGVWAATLPLAVIMPAVGMIREWTIASAHVSQASVTVLAGDTQSLAQQRFFEHGVLVLSRGWINGMTGLYLVLGLTASLRLLLGISKARKLSRSLDAVTLTSTQQQIWQRCNKVFKVNHAMLHSTQQVSGPAVIGWRRPILLLPSNFLNDTDDDELLAALAHECAHIVRRDYLLNFLYECLSLPIAWHPLTRLLKVQIAQIREIVCDQMVAEAVMRPTQYAGALLRLASRIPASFQKQDSHIVKITVGIFDANILEKRVMNLRTKRRLLGWRMKGAIAIAAAAIAAGCAYSAVALTLRVNHSLTPTTSMLHNEQIYTVGSGVSAPALIYSVDPEFPKKGHQAPGFQGQVLVKMVVDKKGLPRNVKVVRSLAPKFDASALAAAQQYRFNPAMHDGQPVDVSIHVEVNFRKY